MTFDTIIVGVIVLLAALYAGRKLYRQASREEGCGSCGGCCPTPNERKAPRSCSTSAGACPGSPADPEECSGCPSMCAGSPLGDIRKQ
ncbi:FeoB-associated Cys-rich membrane protein [Oceanidesulfovibrio indonesiensis]|uniref:FeoB-associated Cys-rich membrane protein n=1 Tax=Oceanidesulfovibrio indonesiensis TaxID=54767 RepID=UPI001ABF3A89|nr:FeoB-associated Cys-rich membrane protein [Oceanidesulfovibrio indonesiensis]